MYLALPPLLIREAPTGLGLELAARPAGPFRERAILIGCGLAGRLPIAPPPPGQHSNSRQRCVPKPAATKRIVPDLSSRVPGITESEHDVLSCARAPQRRGTIQGRPWRERLSDGEHSGEGRCQSLVASRPSPVARSEGETVTRWLVTSGLRDRTDDRRLATGD
jgi:hypothetical protein